MNIDILDLLKTATLKLNPIAKKIFPYFADEEIVEINIEVICTPSTPSIGVLNFSAIFNLEIGVDPKKQITEHFNSEKPLVFVPKISDETIQSIENNHQIVGLWENWQEDFVTPYTLDTNRILSDVVLQNIENLTFIDE